jgi:hypothetical protein
MSITVAEPSLLRHFPAVARSPHSRPSPGEAQAEFPVLPSLCCAPVGELPCTGVAGGHAPVSVPPCSGAFGPRHHRSTVDRAPRLRSIKRGPGPRNYPLKSNSLFWVISEILQKVPGLLGNQPMVQILHSDPWNLKNNSKNVPSLRKNPQNNLETS